MKQTLQIANGTALFATIILNYSASTGLINGTTVGEISARYQTYFTPADYAFSIWTLIYLGLIAFIIYQGQSLLKKTADDEVVLQIGWWFVISCFANIFWILAWIFDYITLSVLMMLILLFSLIQIIRKTKMELYDAPLTKIAFVWWPFSLYSGWVTIAFIVNVSAWLTKIEWRGFGISEINWTIIMILSAGIINLTVTWFRNMREFALAGAWGLIAIAVANYGETQAIVYTAIIVAVILLVSSGIHGFKNRKANAYLWK